MDFIAILARDLADKQYAQIQIHDGDMWNLLRAFPNAVLTGRINNYSTYAISEKPLENEETPPVTRETVFLISRRDSLSDNVLYLSSFLDFAEYGQVFLAEHPDTEHSLHRYSLEKPAENDASSSSSAAASAAAVKVAESHIPKVQYVVCFFEKGHWFEIISSFRHDADALEQEKRRHGIKCNVIEYYLQPPIPSAESSESVEQ